MDRYHEHPACPTKICIQTEIQCGFYFNVYNNNGLVFFGKIEEVTSIQNRIIINNNNKEEKRYETRFLH